MAYSYFLTIKTFDDLVLENCYLISWLVFYFYQKDPQTITLISNLCDKSSWQCDKLHSSSAIDANVIMIDFYFFKTNILFPDLRHLLRYLLYFANLVLILRARWCIMNKYKISIFFLLEINIRFTVSQHPKWIEKHKFFTKKGFLSDYSFSIQRKKNIDTLCFKLTIKHSFWWLFY